MEAEHVDIIQSNLRETRTVSSSQLRILMSNLLKKHESRYEPLGHEENAKMMEEILAMQIGFSADQKIEDNDVVEQIIRGFTQGEVDHSVYSQTADDFENAADKKRKEKKEGKKATKDRKVTRNFDPGGMINGINFPISMGKGKGTSEVDNPYVSPSKSVYLNQYFSAKNFFSGAQCKLHETSPSRSAISKQIIRLQAKRINI